MVEKPTYMCGNSTIVEEADLGAALLALKPPA